MQYLLYFNIFFIIIKPKRINKKLLLNKKLIY
jgi:hypothetical protein